MNTIFTRNNILVSLTVAMVFSLIMMVQTVAFADEGGYGWRDVDGGVEITDYNGPKGVDLSIPDQLDGKDVVSIGDMAFIENELTSIVIPDSVVSIEYGAFFYNELTSVEIPDSVEYIDYGAFAHNELTSVVIGDSVTSIGSSAFMDNILTSIEIPDSVVSIEDYAFELNPLEEIRGYDKSYAQKYANDEDINFVCLDCVVEDPEVSSDAQATILGSGIQLSSMADLLVSGEYNKGKVASLTDGKLTYDIVDSRGVEDTYKLQYTVSDFVHEDGETTLNFVDESFTNEAKPVETVDPLNKTNFDGEINLSNLDLEDSFVKAGNYSATATIEIVEVPSP